MVGPKGKKKKEKVMKQKTKPKDERAAKAICGLGSLRY